jgi:hypothetical protein
MISHSRKDGWFVGNLKIRWTDTNVLTFCKHIITNGVGEGLNSKIMSIKRIAEGASGMSRISKPPSTSIAADLASTNQVPGRIKKSVYYRAAS